MVSPVLYTESFYQVVCTQYLSLNFTVYFEKEKQETESTRVRKIFDRVKEERELRGPINYEINRKIKAGMIRPHTEASTENNYLECQQDKTNRQQEDPKQEWKTKFTEISTF